MVLISGLASTAGSFAKDTRIYERSVGSTNIILDFWWVGALAIIALVIYLSWRHSNALTSRLDQRCNAAFADIDTLLSERHSLVPNLVEITKTNLAENRIVLDKLITAQQEALKAMGDLRMKAETRMGDAINSVVNIAAQTPDLKHSEAFKQLRTDITRIEEKITASRRYYNMAVEEYKSVRKSFPTSLFAGKNAKADHEYYSIGDKREELESPIAISLA